jgi:hypothetical protein
MLKPEDLQQHAVTFHGCANNTNLWSKFAFVRPEDSLPVLAQGTITRRKPKQHVLPSRVTRKERD